MPYVCTALRHFEVERKCESIERLDLVHIYDGSLQVLFFCLREKVVRPKPDQHDRFCPTCMDTVNYSLINMPLL